MSDPFDFLNPIASPKTPAQKVPQHAPVGMPPAPVAPMNHPPAFNMSMGAPPTFNGNMNNMNMNNMHMNMGGMPPHGGMMMPGAFPSAPGMGLGMNQPNPYGQQPAQQPPMYDSIKKLLEKKPAVDDASMDFLEGLGSGAKVSNHPSVQPVHAPEPVANPFGAPAANPFGAPQPPAELDFGILGGGAPASAQPASPASGSKSSALASRLAHGKRPTQEAARKNLGFNAGAFTNTGSTAKISLKSVAGGPTSSGEPTVDDFVAGNAPLAPVDDIFAATPTNPPANPTSSSNDIFCTTPSQLSSAMNDPFAMLDPMQKPGTPSNGASSFATAPRPAYPSMANPFDNFGGGSPMAGGNGMMIPQQQQPMYPNGANFMTQQGPPAFNGLGGGNQQFATYNPYQQQMPAPVMMMPPQYQQNQSNAPTKLMPMPSYSGEPIMYDNIKNIMKPADPFATSPNFAALRAPEPTFAPSPPFQTRDTKATIVDFDPFSPKGATPRTPFDFPDEAINSSTAPSSDRLPSFAGKRPTQEEQRSQLGFSSESFAAASAKQSTPRISLKDVNSTANTNNDDNTPYFLEGNDAFMSSNFANLDDFETNSRRGSGGERRSSNPPSESQADHGEIPEECGNNEYDVRFESGRKLGVLMERVDVWNSENQRKESAVVKLVVENGAADRVGVSIGSTVVAINCRSVENQTYLAILDMIKAAPRPLRMRFKRGPQTKDTTQGAILTRISNGTFSVGNLTSGNATWTTKYFAFGGSKMDVLQLFVSRAAYHECVIALYEKRGVHTQIQSFRLCRDHKISPIKCKIYKGYGNLHYFSLTVPSLRFVAAKFASDDYETIKNIWSNTYDAIERKKRMAY